MRKVQLNNSDLLAYFNTVEDSKIIHQWRNIELDTVSIRDDDDAFAYEIKKYRSAHTTLRRLDKKRQSLLDSFIGELNPISYSAANTAAKIIRENFDLINETNTL